MNPIPTRIKPDTFETIQQRLGKYVTVLGPALAMPEDTASAEMTEAMEEAKLLGQPFSMSFNPDPSAFRLQGQPLRVESIAWPLVLCSLRTPTGEFLTLVTLDARRVEIAPLPSHFTKRIRSLYKEAKAKALSRTPSPLLDGDKKVIARVRRNGEDHVLQDDEAISFLKNVFGSLNLPAHPEDDFPDEDDTESSSPITE